MSAISLRAQSARLALPRRAKSPVPVCVAPNILYCVSPFAGAATSRPGDNDGAALARRGTRARQNAARTTSQRENVAPHQEAAALFTCSYFGPSRALPSRSKLRGFSPTRRAAYGHQSRPKGR